MKTQNGDETLTRGTKMITLKCSNHNGDKWAVTAPTFGQAMDKAAATGAITVRESNGSLLVKLGGDYVYVN